MGTDIAKAVAEISTATGTAAVVAELFTEVAQHIEATKWLGACHSSSAILHMLLKEKGINSVIKIGEVVGEVGQQRFWFDHSWIEINGAIFDAAVAYPDRKEGVRLSGMVYAGIDVDTRQPVSLCYGAGKQGGMYPDAQEIAAVPLGVYFQIADQRAHIDALFAGKPQPVPLWTLAASIAEQCGIRTSSKELATKYFDVHREQVYI